MRSVSVCTLRFADPKPPALPAVGHCLHEFKLASHFSYSFHTVDWIPSPFDGGPRQRRRGSRDNK